MLQQAQCCRLVGDGQDGLEPMPEVDAVPMAEGEEEAGGAAAPEVDAETSFTARTKKVLGDLKVLCWLGGAGAEKHAEWLPVILGWVPEPINQLGPCNSRVCALPWILRSTSAPGHTIWLETDDHLQATGLRRL